MSSPVKQNYKTTNWMPYSDVAVQCYRTMKFFLGLPLRQTQRFLQSVPVDPTEINLRGDRVIERTFKRQVVELQMRAAVQNRFTHLETPMTPPVA